MAGGTGYIDDIHTHDLPLPFGPVTTTELLSPCKTLLCNKSVKTLERKGADIYVPIYICQ